MRVREDVEMVMEGINKKIREGVNGVRGGIERGREGVEMIKESVE